MSQPIKPDPNHLLNLIRTKMPFGKYAGWRLIDLPEAYLVWFRQKGFPSGTLGLQLEEMLGIKENGAEPIIRDLMRKMHG